MFNYIFYLLLIYCLLLHLYVCTLYCSLLSFYPLCSCIYHSISSSQGFPPHIHSEVFILSALLPVLASAWCWFCNDYNCMNILYQIRSLLVKFLANSFTKLSCYIVLSINLIQDQHHVSIVNWLFYLNAHHLIQSL